MNPKLGGLNHLVWDILENCGSFLYGRNLCSKLTALCRADESTYTLQEGKAKGRATRPMSLSQPHQSGKSLLLPHGGKSEGQREAEGVTLTDVPPHGNMKMEE